MKEIPQLWKVVYQFFLSKFHISKRKLGKPYMFLKVEHFADSV